MAADEVYRLSGGDEVEGAGAVRLGPSAWAASREAGVRCEAVRLWCAADGLALCCVRWGSAEAGHARGGARGEGVPGRQLDLTRRAVIKVRLSDGCLLRLNTWEKGVSHTTVASEVRSHLGQDWRYRAACIPLDAGLEPGHRARSGGA